MERESSDWTSPEGENSTARGQKFKAKEIIGKLREAEVELARPAHVSWARITQIMNLLFLAPDIQEALLFLPRIERGRDTLHLAQLQPIARVPESGKQRGMWGALADSGPRTA